MNATTETKTYDILFWSFANYFFSERHSDLIPITNLQESLVTDSIQDVKSESHERT